MELQEIQQSFRELQREIYCLTAQNIDLSGRRVINAGRSVGGFDYVRQDELSDMNFDSYYAQLKARGLDGFPGILRDAQLSRLATLLCTSTTRPAQTQAGVIFYESDTALLRLCTGTGYLTINAHVRVDTYANRGAAASYPYQLFAASDKNYQTWISNASAWLHFAGYDSLGMSSIAGLLGTFTTADINYRIWCTDYEHLYEWHGTTLDFADGDVGSGFVIMSLGSAPTAGVWALCDGSTVGIAQANGTASNVALPDLTDYSFIVGGTYSVNHVDAARAAWEAAAKTADESAHTHAVDPASTTSGTPSATQVVQSGTGVTVAGGTHTHDTDIASTTSGAGAAHSHALTDALSQLKTFSLANGGLPQHRIMSFYVRR